jgi:uncharacterized protein YkwD
MFPSLLSIKPIYGLISICLLSACLNHLRAQPYKVKDLQFLLNDSTSNVVEYIGFSRTVSELFHEKINTYRISKKKKPLQWNDTLWLVALNQSIYIDSNDDFTHKQSPAKSIYSGQTPLKRYQFVMDNPSLSAGCGENIFQWSTALISAESLSTLMFDSWKDSPGHNENMLNEYYTDHALAIYPGYQGITCTNVFLVRETLSQKSNGQTLKKRSKRKQFNLSN